MKVLMRGVLPLLLCIVLTVIFVAGSGNVDCRKYIYAPKCRGVSAKRGLGPVDYDRNISPYPYEFDSQDYPSEFRMGPARSHSGSRMFTDSDYDRTDTDTSASSLDKHKDELEQGRFLRALVRMYFDRRSTNEE